MSTEGLTQLAHASYIFCNAISKGMAKAISNPGENTDHVLAVVYVVFAGNASDEEYDQVRDALDWFARYEEIKLREPLNGFLAANPADDSDDEGNGEREDRAG
jgi:hypothetical protein